MKTNKEILLALYSEASNVLRHYSNLVMQVRIITIVQGLIVLGGAGYFVVDSKYLFSIAISIFGFLFTGILYSLTRNYWKHFSSVLGEAKKYEALLSEQENFGPWTIYESQRRKRHGKQAWKISAIHGPFLLLLISFSAFLAYCLIKYF